jgi:hypothetical protein
MPGSPASSERDRRAVPRICSIVALPVALVIAVAGCGGDDGRTTSSTTTTSSVRPPAQVRVFVLNGSGVDQAAATKADELRALDYAIAGVGNAPEQPGTVVACRPGFDGETVELAGVLGTVTIVEFPDPEPDGVEEADCIVGLGRA